MQSTQRGLTIMTIGIIGAMEEEVSQLKQAMHIEETIDHATMSFCRGQLCGKDVVIVKSGIGKVNAASATAFLIGDDKADIILNAGLSGAVQKLRREDMIAVESYVECDYDLTAIGKPLGVKADGQKYIYSADEKLMSYALMSEGIISAKAGTGDIFLTDKVKKELYKDTFGIESFDMESAAIAGVCDKCGIPMLSLRKISDDADDASVEDYREMNNRQESCLTELLANIFSRILEDSSQW